MDNIKKSSYEGIINLNKKNLVVRLVLILTLIPLFFLALGEAFTSLFNPFLELDTLDRILASFKPTVYLLAVVLAAIYNIFVYRQLNSVFAFLKTGEKTEKARTATISVPWFIIIANIIFWSLGTIVFYAMYNWESPGGIPLFWALIIKISLSLFSAIFTIQLLNGVLLPYKRLLEITKIQKGEKDVYWYIQNYLIIISSCFFVAVIVGYFFFYSMNTANMTTLNGNLAFLVILLFGCLFSFSLCFLSRREFMEQLNYLNGSFEDLINSEHADLSRKMIITHFGEIGKLSFSYNRLIDKFRMDFSQLKRLVIDLQAYSQEVLASANKLSKTIDNNTKNAESIVATLEQFSSTLELISNNVAEQNDHVSHSASAALDVSLGVKNIVETSVLMKEQADKNTQSASEGMDGIRASIENSLKISEYVGKITDLIKVAGFKSKDIDSMIEKIQDIAEETDILSINAAIEAANAGSSGKGFSVVAGEIRKLSTTSSQSAENISTIMGQMKDSIFNAVAISKEGQNESIKGKDMSEKAKTSLKDIIFNVRETSDMINKIIAIAQTQRSDADNLSSSTEKIKEFSGNLNISISEQSQGADHILRFMQDILKNTETEADASEKLANLAGDLEERNKKLLEIIDQFVI